jgi:hypothetical protein
MASRSEYDYSYFFIPVSHFHNFSTVISKIPVILYHVRNFYESGKFRINFIYHIPPPPKKITFKCTRTLRNKYTGNKQNWSAEPTLTQIQRSTYSHNYVSLMCHAESLSFRLTVPTSNHVEISPSTSSLSSKILSYSQDFGVNSSDVSLQNDPSSSYYHLTLNSQSMFPTIITQFGGP